ncbi:MAG: AI-2E family transporter [Bacteroidota bacterium]
MTMNKQQKSRLVLGLTVLFGGVILFALKGLISAILGSVVMYSLFRPFIKYLVVTKKMNKVLATLIVLMSSFVSVVVPVSALAMLIISKVRDVANDPAELLLIVEKINHTVGNFFHDPNMIDNLLKDGQTFILAFLTNVIGGSFDMLLQTAVMYFLLYFMFVDFQRFEQALLKYSPFSKRNTELFAVEIHNSTKSNVLAQGFIACIQGALLGLGFYIFNLPDPLFWGIVAIFLSFLPVVGAPVIFIPGSLYAISTGNEWGGYGMLISGLVIITNIDNLIRFAINRRIADTHPIVTVVGVIIGIPLFGIVGLVFGPLLFSFFILLVKIYREEREPGTQHITVPKVKPGTNAQTAKDGKQIPQH